MGISISNATSSAITKYSESLRSGEPDWSIVYLVATPPSPCRINNASTGYQKSRTGVIY